MCDSKRMSRRYGRLRRQPRSAPTSTAMLFVRFGGPVFLKLIQCGFESGLYRLGLRLRFAEPGADVGKDGIDFLEIARIRTFELGFKLAHNSNVEGRFQKLRVGVFGNRVIQNEPVIFGKTFDG